MRDLLGYLLLNRDTFHPREQLAGLLWCELDDRKARHCLNTALWRLNQVLMLDGERDHPYLRIGRESIGFNMASDFRLDIAEFESCCMLARDIGSRSTSQQAALYRQAVDLYQADLLIDCYDDWCMVERERLVRLYLRALSALVTYHADRDDFDAAIDYALRILAYDPLREEIHQALIKLYLETNQPAAALRQYRTCEETVRREIGMEPMPETQALWTRVMEEVAPQVPAPQCKQSNGPFIALSGGRGTYGVGAALESLHEAVATFESAYAQLLEATARVEEAADSLGYDPATQSVRRFSDVDSSRSQLLRARTLMGEAASHLRNGREGNSA